LPLLLAIFITTLIDRTLFWISISLGVLAIAPVGRLARAQTLVYAEKEFVSAARILGAKDGRILLREIIPNVVIPMSALALLGMGIAIVAEGTLAFLGVSVNGGVSWGKLNYAGDRLREVLDAKELAL